MFSGNRPDGAVKMIHQCEIFPIVFKLADDCPVELKDQKFVNKLIEQSVDICTVLGHVFRQFKEDLKQNGEVKFSEKTICIEGSDHER